jgi:hypothetical protein
VEQIMWAVFPTAQVIVSVFLFCFFLAIKYLTLRFVYFFLAVMLFTPINNSID